MCPTRLRTTMSSRITAPFGIHPAQLTHSPSTCEFKFQVLPLTTRDPPQSAQDGGGRGLQVGF